MLLPEVNKSIDYRRDFKFLLLRRKSSKKKLTKVFFHDDFKVML